MTGPNPPPGCRKTDCGVCIVHNPVLFSSLGGQRVATLREPIDECVLPAGSTLYRIGESGAAAFTLRSGLIKLVQYLSDGSERVVRLVYPSDVTGLEVLLAEDYRHDAIVVSDARVCRLPRTLLEGLFDTEPELRRELLRRWQRALAEADAWLTELSTGTARQRVARLLLRLSDDAGEGICSLPNRRDMAAMLALTQETASRQVARFKREGLLDCGSGGFRCRRSALVHESE